MARLESVVFLGVTIHSSPLETLLRDLISKKALQARIDHEWVAAEKMERRLKIGNMRPDLLSYILAHNNEKGGRKIQVVSKNVALLISAVSETTAISLNGVTWFLLQNRDCLRLDEEIRAAFETRGEVSLQKIGEMEFFHAVMTKSNAPSCLERLATSSFTEGDTVSGY